MKTAQRMEAKMYRMKTDADWLGNMRSIRLLERADRHSAVIKYDSDQACAGFAAAWARTAARGSGC